MRLQHLCVELTSELGARRPWAGLRPVDIIIGERAGGV